MKSYETIEDFLVDESFQDWVLLNSNASFWNEFIIKHPEKKELINTAAENLKLMKFSESERSDSHINESWQALEKRLVFKNIRKSGILGTSKQMLKYAASLAGIILCAALFYFIQISDKKSVATAYGEIKEVVLPDNSLVVLNSNSELVYSKNWDEVAIREVWVKGEAFFKVEKETDKRRKFVVHTENINVEVLGTQFNVQERRGESKVVLNSGKVKVEINSANDIELNPGEMVIYDVSKDSMKLSTVNPEVHTSWSHEKLVFENTPVHEIASMIEDVYGYQVVILDENIHEREFTARIPSRDLDVLLLALSESFDMKVEKSENEILINNK